MSVSRRPNGSWLIYFAGTDGRRIRKTVSGSIPRRDVEALERRMRADEAAGRHHAPTRTVADLLARYWTEHGGHLASRVSEAGYLDALSDALGERTDLATVTRDVLSEVVARWRTEPNRRHNVTRTAKAKPVGPSTINKRVRCLQRAWLRAEELWGWSLPRIPWRRLMLAEPEQRDRSLSPAERRAFTAAVPARSRGLVRLAFATGLRRGALLKLTAADIDIERGVIRAVSKGKAGGKATPVPITREVAAILRLIKPPAAGPVFAVTLGQLRADLETAAAATKLPPSVHQARHTFAQSLEDAGLGDVITDALHHSSPTLRRRYAKARLERTRAALETARGKRRGVDAGKT